MVSGIGINLSEEGHILLRKIEALEKVSRELKDGMITMLTNIKAQRGLRLHENIFLENLKDLSLEDRLSGGTDGGDK